MCQCVGVHIAKQHDGTSKHTCEVTLFCLLFTKKSRERKQHNKNIEKLFRNPTCEPGTLFIFLEKTEQKIVVALESLCFQGRSPRQAHIRVINGCLECI